MKRPVIVGLTGQSGAGKSTVSDVFSQNGFYVINCDKLTHTLLQPGTDCSKALKNGFPQFFDGDTINRRKAAPLLFSDSKLLDRYNKAIFPFITNEIERRINEAAENGEGYILLDAPTLFEAGADVLCDIIVSCVADKDVRVRRITERDGISLEEALKRFSSQHEEGFFRERSDHTIENNGSIEEAKTAAFEIAKKIKERQNGN